MSRNSSNSSNSPSETSETSYSENFRGMSAHRCFRCRRFYGKCKCHKRMFRNFRKGCMCRMILKGLLVALAIYLISRLLKSVDNVPSSRPSLL
jgi:hypothetical protein